jgi:energy-coupling factor transporter ATP-binding protein EcfA2
MGDGAPGTGKTTLIQMMAGLIHGYCQAAGYPFRYQNFSIDQIDSYQGKSGQNAKAFIDAVLDPVRDRLRHHRRHRPGRRQARRPAVQRGPAGGDGGLHAGLRRGEHGGARQLHLRDVLELPRERGRRAAPAGRRAVPRGRADQPRGLHRHPALLLGKNHKIPLGDHELYAAQEIRRAVAASFESHGVPHEDGPARRLGPGGEARSGRSTPSRGWGPI